ncbi:MAG: autotransporter outer membrane beta-barrel domain-containing protein [Saprospiraceae bacterium]
MKKLTVFAMFFMLIYGVYAQEESLNRKFVSGGVVNFLIQHNTFPLSSTFNYIGNGGIYSNSTNETKNTTFTISPYAGKELNPHLILGIQLDYRIGRYKVEDNLNIITNTKVDTESNYNNIGFGVFTRHTLYPEKQFNFYFQPYIKYNLYTDEVKHNSTIIEEEKANFISLGVGLGILYNINNRWRATLRAGGLNYAFGNWEVIGTDRKKTFSAFGTDLNLSSIFLGFEVKM